VCDGSAKASTTSGTAPFSYKWSNGQTTQSIVSLCAGNYAVTVTDANNCKSTATVTIKEPPALSAITAKVDVKCFGGNDGAASVTANGGVAPYTYKWNTGATTQGITGLTVGIYAVTVKDANNAKNIKTITINQPTDLTVTAVVTHMSCNGLCDGKIDITPSGGTPAYSYSWTTGSTTQDINSLCVNTYTVTITDANNCKEIASAAITQPAILTVTAGADSVSCFAGSDGSSSATPSGGTSPYSYKWSNNQTSQTAVNLVTGSHCVTVTDNKGCKANGCVTVQQPALIVLTMDSTDVSCAGGFDGKAGVVATGGVGSYKYKWNNAGTTASISNLTAGLYTVTVTDKNGCSKVDNIAVVQPTGVTLATSTTPVLCFAGNDGTASITATGGVGGYTYKWITGSTSQVITVSAGTYTVTVRDANNCPMITSQAVAQPTDVLLTTSSVAVKCFGGSNGIAIANTSGGIAPYTYKWTTGSTNDSITASTGTYTATVTDANNCRKNKNIFVSQPTDVKADTGTTDVICFGNNNGTAAVTASGGVGGYTYKWNTGATVFSITNIAGTYTVSVRDANNCLETATAIINQPPDVGITLDSADVSCFAGSDGIASVVASGGVAGGYTYSWSNGKKVATNSGLTAGTYTVTVRDGNLCREIGKTTVLQPTDVTLDTGTTDVKCLGGNDGTAGVTANGGVGGYTYSWSTGDTTQSITSSAGMYTVIVTDANNCPMSVQIVINEPTGIVLSSDSTDVTCNGGSDGTATVLATGGVAGGYTFSWSSGETTATITRPAGTYLATVKDGNNCTKQLNITILEPTDVKADTSTTDVICNGDATGTATVTPKGGIAGYTYSWITGENTQTITQAAGTWTVTVRDANQCIEIVSLIINEPSKVTVTASMDSVSCANGIDGKVYSQGSGGVGG
ncbi:MAG: gliding motility-like protein, partial [Bacteroidetes bacterium]